jgi:hypothetical protein
MPKKASEIRSKGESMKNRMGLIAFIALLCVSAFADGRFKFIEGKNDKPRIKLDTYTGKAWQIQEADFKNKTTEIKFEKPAPVYKKPTYSIARKYTRLTEDDILDEPTLIDGETGKTWEMKYLDHENPSWVLEDGQ